MTRFSLPIVHGPPPEDRGEPRHYRVVEVVDEDGPTGMWVALLRVPHINRDEYISEANAVKACKAHRDAVVASGQEPPGADGLVSVELAVELEVRFEAWKAHGCWPQSGTGPLAGLSTETLQDELEHRSRVNTALARAEGK